MSSICPGLSVRGRSRRMSHLLDRQPVEKVADALLAKPDALKLLRRIDGIRGQCDREIESEPAMNELRSRQLVRFYSSHRNRTSRFWVHVLAKGDMVLDELDRRIETEGGTSVRVRSRLSATRRDVRGLRSAAA